MFRPIVAAAAILFATGAAIGQSDAKAPAKSTTAAQPTDAKQKPYALMVGDKAPALQVEKWVKGEPITGFEKGKVYVVEFWATWCGPCIAAFPHLSELQKEYKDDGVTIIGMTSRDGGNSLEKVEEMVAEKGETMGYTVAWDVERKTNEAYMKAAGQNGIPCSYIVDRNGMIAYIGHPMSMDKTLEEVVNGTFDLAKAKESYAKRRANEARMQPAQRKFGVAMQAGKYDDALAALDELEELDPDLAPMLAGQRFNVLLMKGDTDKAYAVANEIVDTHAKDDAQTLNMIAWTIVDPDGDVEEKDLNLALKAANRAAELTKNKDGSILDTLALVHFLKGDTAKAIELQTKAVELTEGTPMQAELKARLEEFKAKK